VGRGRRPPHDPLADYATHDFERRAIAELAQWSNSGDIIVFGAYAPQPDRCICFDDQIGAHGAYGGRQGWPFIMAPNGLIPDDYEICDPLDIHPLLKRYSERTRR
jgi:hypothetical protein